MTDFTEVNVEIWSSNDVNADSFLFQKLGNNFY